MSVFDGLADIFADVLGQPVRVAPQGGAKGGPLVEIMAIPVNRPSMSAEIAQGMPMMHARLQDVAFMNDGDLVLMGGVMHVARTFEPDGKGMVQVTLEQIDGGRSGWAEAERWRQVGFEIP
jgi:hypothetical protein